MTFLRKTKNTGWYIGGAVAALMMILLAESSTPPRYEVATFGTKTAQKDYRPILKNIKTVPEHLMEEKAGYQTLLAKRMSGVPEPANGPMAILSQMEEVHTIYLDQLDISIIEIPATWDADWLVGIVREDPSVDYAGVDRNEYILPQADPPGIIPNDEDFRRQTNLHDPDNDVDVDAPEAWAYTTGSNSVVVAVFDAGIDITTPDLIPNLWVNSSEVANNNMDDDMNECVDDIHGCNLRRRFSDGSGMIEDERNEEFHGTGVSGVLGARGNNDYGIAGVAWNIRIMALKGLWLRVYDYILEMRRRGVNIRIMHHGTISALRNCNPDNLSYTHQMQYESIRDLGEAGILVVAPMGNNGMNFNEPDDPYMLSAPFCYRLNNIISVAGQSKIDRTRWSRTNYGSVAADLFAPAERVYTHTYNPLLHPSGRAERSGTSFAAPHVTGAAALLWSFKPDLTVTQVRSALLDTVDRFPNYDGEVASGGALNIANALYSVATPGIRIHSSQTTIAEGTSGYIDLSLTREPVRPSLGEVVVLEGVATPLSDADAVVTPSTLTFTSRNWHIPQRMTVRAAGTSGTEITLQVEVDRHLSTTHYHSVAMRDATMTLQSEGIRPTLHIPARIAEGDTATATIRFSDPLINAAQFTITAIGTATKGTDYTLLDTITATTDSNSVTFTIPTITDNTYEPDETIHLQITTPESSVSPQTLQATLTIEDSDTPIMTITVLPDVIFQGSQTATAQTATATITLDRPAVDDVLFFLASGSIYRHDISHLRNDISHDVWPTSATIITGGTSTEIIIHSIDEDEEPSIFQRITLSLDISPNTAARLGTPHRATLRVWDDDGNTGLYLRLRVFMEGAMITDTTTIQTDP